MIKLNFGMKFLKEGEYVMPRINKSINNNIKWNNIKYK